MLFIKMKLYSYHKKGMSKVFNVGVPAISKHLKNIFEENELEKNAVISKMEITAPDGKNYNTEVYSLDAIIAVCYKWTYYC